MSARKHQSYLPRTIQTPKTTLAATREEAITTHNRLVEAGHFAIYTDGSWIEGKVGASAVTVFAPYPGKRQLLLTGSRLS